MTIRLNDGADIGEITFEEIPHPILQEADIDWISEHGRALKMPALEPATIAMLVVDFLTARGYVIVPPAKERAA